MNNSRAFSYTEEAFFFRHNAYQYSVCKVLPILSLSFFYPLL